MAGGIILDISGAGATLGDVVPFACEIIGVSMVFDRNIVTAGGVPQTFSIYVNDADSGVSVIVPDLTLGDVGGYFTLDGVLFVPLGARVHLVSGAEQVLSTASISTIIAKPEASRNSIETVLSGERILDFSSANQSNGRMMPYKARLLGYAILPNGSIQTPGNVDQTFDIYVDSVDTGVFLSVPDGTAADVGAFYVPSAEIVVPQASRVHLLSGAQQIASAIALLTPLIRPE